MPDLYSNFAELMKVKGRSGKWLAENTNTSMATISALKVGHRLPTLTVALKIADALECDVRDIWSLKPFQTDLLTFAEYLWAIGDRNTHGTIEELSADEGFLRGMWGFRAEAYRAYYQAQNKVHKDFV